MVPISVIYTIRIQPLYAKIGSSMAKVTSWNLIVFATQFFYLVGTKGCMFICDEF